MNQERFRIGKTYISATNPKDAEERITHAALNGNGGYICVSNMRMVMYAGKDPEYAKLMDESFMNLPDGMPLTWCGKLWGLKEIANTNGPALFKKMLSEGNPGLKHYLLGDTQDVLNSIKDKYKSVDIVGAEALPFAKVEEFDYQEISENIKKSGANIVWTAMTAPKQDEFDRIISRMLPNVVFIGVGRAFRMSIGDVKKAPRWAEKMGIGGFFIRRRKWYQTGWWYIKTSFSLAYYMIQIICKRVLKK